MTLATVDTPPKKTGPSLVAQVGVLAAMTLVAVGGGWFAGQMLKAGAPAETVAPAVVAEPMQVDVPVEDGEGASGGHGSPASGGHGEESKDGEAQKVQLIPRLVPLEAITTNIAAPSDIWVRMELSLVFSGPPAPDLVRTIHQDILAYIRTVTLQQVQGPSGFQHLRYDIEERAKLRSAGLATQLVIRTLLFE